MVYNGGGEPLYKGGAMPQPRNNAGRRAGGAAVQADEESARDKFVRLAEGRTGMALEGIRLLRHLADRDRYEYAEGDVDAIVTALRSELDATEDALRGGKRRGAGFKLSTGEEA